jgi:hypothetical protein
MDVLRLIQRLHAFTKQTKHAECISCWMEVKWRFKGWTHTSIKECLARACARACVRMRVHACACVYMHAHARVRAHADAGKTRTNTTWEQPVFYDVYQVCSYMLSMFKS